MVSQAVKYGSLVLPCAVAWLALVLEWFPGLHPTTPEGRNIVLLIPLWVVVLLGVYALGSVVYGVATFNSCTEASDELRLEIKEAKKELRGKGITFPSE